MRKQIEVIGFLIKYPHLVYFLTKAGSNHLNECKLNDGGLTFEFHQHKGFKRFININHVLQKGQQIQMRHLFSSFHYRYKNISYVTDADSEPHINIKLHVFLTLDMIKRLTCLPGICSRRSYFS